MWPSLTPSRSRSWGRFWTRIGSMAGLYPNGRTRRSLSRSVTGPVSLSSAQQEASNLKDEDANRHVDEANQRCCSEEGDA